MDIITIFWVRGKIEPKNVPVGIGCLRGLLKKRLLLSGDSKSLALLGYYYTIEGHHLILHCQNWWTLPLNSSFTFQRWDSHFNSVVRGYQITGTILFFFFYKVTKDWGGGSTPVSILVSFCVFWIPEVVRYQYGWRMFGGQYKRNIFLDFP